jgi:hypothetical protein
MPRRRERSQLLLAAASLSANASRPPLRPSLDRPGRNAARSPETRILADHPWAVNPIRPSSENGRPQPLIGTHILSINSAGDCLDRRERQCVDRHRFGDVERVRRCRAERALPRTEASGPAQTHACSRVKGSVAAKVRHCDALPAGSGRPDWASRSLRAVDGLCDALLEGDVADLGRAWPSCDRRRGLAFRGRAGRADGLLVAGGWS